MEVPAGVDIAGDRSARPVGLLSTREFPLIAVVAAFFVAVLLGAGIGFATADRGSGSGGGNGAADAPAAQLSPVQRTAPWETQRVPGTANQLQVTAEPDPVALRLALQWTVTDEIKKAGGPATITADMVTVKSGMLYFGAVEGTSAATDEYWAIGRIEVKGMADPPADPHVWRRLGSAPWAIVAHGAGACEKIPAALLNVWKGQPAPCAA